MRGLLLVSLRLPLREQLVDETLLGVVSQTALLQRVSNLIQVGDETTAALRFLVGEMHPLAVCNVQQFLRQIGVEKQQLSALATEGIGR